MTAEAIFPSCKSRNVDCKDPLEVGLAGQLFDAVQYVNVYKICWGGPCPCTTSTKGFKNCSA